MNRKPGDIYVNANHKLLILLLREDKYGDWHSLVLSKDDAMGNFLTANFGGYSGWTFVCSLDS
jgi:hypothetical protein